MQPVNLPFIHQQDPEVLLCEWSVADGATVTAGQTIAIFETAKATYDLPAPVDGVLAQLASAGQTCRVGDVVARLFTDEAERDAFSAGEEPDAKDETASTAPDAVMGEPLEKFQAGIARIVGRSHATIPASYVVKKIFVDAAQDALKAFGKEHKMMVVLPDWIVQLCVAKIAKFPKFFGELHEADGQLRFRSSQAGNVGVTFDLGKGLYIGVLKDAVGMGLTDITKAMMRLRFKAMRGQFKNEDLQGGDFSVSITMHEDIVFVVPIVYPPQTAMLSVGAVQEELYLREDGSVGQRKFCYFGVAFDHRILNGGDANDFLSALKLDIENPVL